MSRDRGLFDSLVRAYIWAQDKAWFIKVALSVRESHLSCSVTPEHIKNELRYEIFFLRCQDGSEVARDS